MRRHCGQDLRSSSALRRRGAAGRPGRLVGHIGPAQGPGRLHPNYIIIQYNGRVAGGRSTTTWPGRGGVRSEAAQRPPLLVARPGCAALGRRLRTPPSPRRTDPPAAPSASIRSPGPPLDTAAAAVFVEIGWFIFIRPVHIHRCRAILMFVSIHRIESRTSSDLSARGSQAPSGVESSSAGERAPKRVPSRIICKTSKHRRRWQVNPFSSDPLAQD